MRIFVPIACCLAAACSQAPEKNENKAATVTALEEAQHLPRIFLRIRHGELAPDKSLMVEVALTSGQQEKGLMHRTELKTGEGMLFPMVPPRMPNFWMKDTPIPLDIVFIRTDGGIARIVTGAKPNDRTPIFAEEPVSGVLELGAGEAEALALDEGDRISWGECARADRAMPVVEADNFCPA